MASLRIRIYGDPCLREVSEPVDEIDDEIKELAADMIEIMYENSGIGLAAPQVGIGKRLFVADTQEQEGPSPMVFINPSIRNQSGTSTMEEGCLSIPDVREDVKRAESFDFEALDLEGNVVRFRADGLLGRVILHEVDHFEGKLFVDYLSPVKKIMVKDQLRALEKESIAASS